MGIIERRSPLRALILYNPRLPVLTGASIKLIESEWYKILFLEK
jgi:hypothetical protein